MYVCTCVVINLLFKLAESHFRNLNIQLGVEILFVFQRLMHRNHVSITDLMLFLQITLKCPTPVVASLLT